MKSSATIDENGTYLPMTDVVRAIRAVAPEGKITNISLKADEKDFVFTSYVASENGQQEVRVRPDGTAEIVVPTTGQKIHYWVKKLHEFQFFGTKKELTAFSGLGLLTLLATGLILWKRRSR